MIKRIVALLLALLLPTVANAAGTINLSLSQQFDNQGNPLSGCKLYSYQAGTTTPINAYFDDALTLPQPWPMECDASGRIGQFFYDDGAVKVRLTDRNGVSVFTADNVLVIGPSGGGGGGGGAVDPTTIMATGDAKWRYGTGTLTGFVRANGRTIGSATSGATERAHADTQALFEYLWASDPNLTVSGGRGASGNADWLANKTIGLPDARGRMIAGMDDMGASPASRITSITATTLGAAGGDEDAVITTPNLPPISYTPAGSVSVANHTHSITDPGHSHPITDPGHDHDYFAAGTTPGTFAIGGLTVMLQGTGSTSTDTTGISIGNDNTDITINSASLSPVFSGTPASLGGSSSEFSVINPVIVMTLYIKL